MLLSELNKGAWDEESKLSAITFLNLTLERCVVKSTFALNLHGFIEQILNISEYVSVPIFAN